MLTKERVQALIDEVAVAPPDRPIAGPTPAELRELVTAWRVARLIERFAAGINGTDVAEFVGKHR